MILTKDNRFLIYAKTAILNVLNVSLAVVGPTATYIILSSDCISKYSCPSKNVVFAS